MYSDALSIECNSAGVDRLKNALKNPSTHTVYLSIDGGSTVDARLMGYLLRQTDKLIVFEQASSAGAFVFFMCPWEKRSISECMSLWYHSSALPAYEFPDPKSHKDAILTVEKDEKLFWKLVYHETSEGKFDTTLKNLKDKGSNGHTFYANDLIKYGWVSSIHELEPLFERS